jgi:hypothetical protein
MNTTLGRRSAPDITRRDKAAPLRAQLTGFAEIVDHALGARAEPTRP